MNNSKTVIIVDDEADARKLICQYLEAYADFEIVAEASDGLQAVEKINLHKPDIVFLDIQMPGLTGFEVLTQLSELPQVIFSTAYDSFAIQAFEVHAIDYLLKPYGRKRFDKTIAHLQSVQNNIQPLAEELLSQKAEYPSKIIVHKGAKLVMLNVSRIIRIEAYGDYCKLLTEQAQYLSNAGIGIIESKLNPAQFMRVHRSAIVNFEYVVELEKNGRVYQLVLENQDKIRVSNSYLEAIKELIY